jgi:hypothetical protein
MNMWPIKQGIIGFSNGIFDANKKELMKFDSSFYVRYLLPYPFLWPKNNKIKVLETLQRKTFLLSIIFLSIKLYNFIMNHKYAVKILTLPFTA